MAFLLQSPQWLILPLGIEAHRVQVDFREGGKKCKQLVLEIVARGDDVEEILDDANIIVCPSLVCSRIYPGAGHSGHIVWNNGIDLVPNAGVMAAGITRKRYDIHPRLKHGCVKEELLGHRLLVCRGEIPEYPRDVSKREDFRQYPCRRIGV